MKKTIILVCLLLAQGRIFAQFNFSQIQNQHSHNLASAMLPSLLGNDLKNGEVHLFSPYLGFANNFISAYDLQKLTASGNLTNAEIDKVLGKIPKQGSVWAGVDMPILNIFFNINNKKKERFLSFGVGMREKMDFNFTLNKNLLSLIYKGNKQFAGQDVNLAPSLNFLFYNEYFLAAAGQFQLFKKDTAHKPITIKPAIRLRYLNGMAGIHMKKANINMYTDPEGRYINLATRLEVNMSSAIDTPDIESAIGDVDFSNFKGSGKGFGVDLGVGVTLMENLQVHVAVIDIGSISFKRNAINYTKNSTYTYEGTDISQEGETISTAKLENLIQPDKSYKKFKQPLPTRLILSGSYGLKPKVKGKVSYYQHFMTLTYLQGFRNYLSATGKPTVNLGYNYSVSNMVNSGIGLTFGGLNKIMAGAQFGFRLGAVKLGLMSNNLLPLITAKAGRGTDFNMYLGFFF